MEQEFNKLRTLDEIGALLDGPLGKLGVAPRFQDLRNVLSTPQNAIPLDTSSDRSPGATDRHFKKALNVIELSLLGAANRGQGHLAPGEGDSLDWIEKNVRGGKQLVENFTKIVEPLSVAGYHHSIGANWERAADVAVKSQQARAVTVKPGAAPASHI